MGNCKLAFSPFATHFKLSSECCPQWKEDIEKMSNVLYSSAIGSRMYTMECTSIDLSYAIIMVNRFMHNPGKDHWEAVKWIHRHMKGTINK